MSPNAPESSFLSKRIMLYHNELEGERKGERALLFLLTFRR
jgi:hypothetical protein